VSDPLSDIAVDASDKQDAARGADAGASASDQQDSADAASEKELEDKFPEGNMSPDQADAKAEFVPAAKPFDASGPVDEMPTHVQADIRSKALDQQAKHLAKAEKADAKPATKGDLKA
jgi:hypothetical protein